MSAVPSPRIRPAKGTKPARVWFTVAAWEAWLPIVLIAAWWFGSAASTSAYFPPLSSIVDRIWRGFIIGDGIATQLLPSLANLAVAFVIALVIGISLGMFIGARPRLRRAFEPVLEFLRAVPAVAILPIAIIAIGLGDDMRIAVIAFGAVWPILLNTIDGARSIDPVLVDLQRVYSVDWWVRMFLVRLPAASPQILAGARVGLAISVIMIVVSEMSGAIRGIGYFLLTSQRNFAIGDMWAAMVVLGVVGYLLNLIFRAIEARLLRWHAAHR